MGEMITKPDANPIVFAALNFLLFGALGYFLMGQQKKAMITGVVWFVMVLLSPCTLGLSTFVILPLILVTTYDAYLLGQKLAAGESIGMNENGLSFLDSVFKD